MYQHIFITIASGQHRNNRERLQRLYSLTPGETDIALLIACGRTVQECSAIKRVSLTTVRTHLQSIYGKTDTHRQSELVAVLLAGPAQLQVECVEADELAQAGGHDLPAWSHDARP